MQDKYLDLPQEYLNLNRAFQNPNIPEFNKQYLKKKREEKYLKNGKN